MWCGNNDEKHWKPKFIAVALAGWLASWMNNHHHRRSNHEEVVFCVLSLGDENTHTTIGWPSRQTHFSTAVNKLVIGFFFFFVFQKVHFRLIKFNCQPLFYLFFSSVNYLKILTFFTDCLPHTHTHTNAQHSTLSDLDVSKLLLFFLAICFESRSIVQLQSFYSVSVY